MSSKPTKADYEQELLDLRAEQDSPLVRARTRFQQRILDDADWWYDLAKKLAETSNSREDQTRVQMVTKILDKIMPDRKEISRGAARVKGGVLQFNMPGAKGTVHVPSAKPDPIPEAIDVTPGAAQDDEDDDG